MTLPNREHPGDATQLDLFTTDESAEGDTTQRISPMTARWSVSPGWWPFIAPFVHSVDGLPFIACHERDGELILRVASDDDDDGWVEETLDRIRRQALRTCGACGGTPAAAYRQRIEGPTYRVCTRCRERLIGGESFLAIADDHWKLDGTRRDTLAPGAHSVGRGLIAVADERPPLLSGADLRRAILDVRESLAATVTGQESALSTMAVIAATHLHCDLPRGARALLLGRTGVGKSTTIGALRSIFEQHHIPFGTVDLGDLTTAGWRGSCIADVVQHAIGSTPVSSWRARKAVIVLEEVHHVASDPGELTGNLAKFRNDLLSSLLGLCGGGSIRFESGVEYSAQHALVIGVGAFGNIDLTRPVGLHELTTAGALPLELCTRLAEEIIVLQPLPEHALVQLLMAWPALTGLVDVCARLGLAVRIVDETYRRAARAVTLSHDGASPRTAGGWLVSALRRAMIAAISDPTVAELVITPDSLDIPLNATRHDAGHGDEEGGASGGWSYR